MPLIRVLALVRPVALAQRCSLVAVGGVLLALSGGTQPAHAEDLPPTSEFFDEFDTNSDGKVTQSEFRGSAEIFRLLDKDGDGSISATELGLPVDYKPDPRRRKRKAGGEARAEDGEKRGRAGGKAGAKRREQLRKRLIAMDTDKDGKVSRAEWTGPEQTFDRLDRNKDGVIDKADRTRRGQPGGDRKRPGDAPRGDAPRGDAPRGDAPGKGRTAPDAATKEERAARVRAHFKRVDKNGDGKITADEAPNAKLLEGADADGDGGVTLEEFLGFVKKRAQAGRKNGAAQKGSGEKGGARRPGKGKRGGKMSAGMLKRWDQDGDGKVSADEFPGRDKAFKRFDLDKDGFLTEADVAAAKKKAAARKAAAKGDAAPKNGGEEK